MIKAALTAQLLLACASIMAQDQNLHKFDLDYIITATRDTQMWRDMTDQAHQYIQKINALEGQPSQDDIIGTLLTFSKDVWDNLVPQDVDFSGRIDFSIAGQEIADANVLPMNTLVIRFTIQELSQSQPELWESIQNILADALKTLEEQRTVSTQNPVDFIQSHIIKIREIIHNNPTQLGEFLGIWLKVERQKTA